MKTISQVVEKIIAESPLYGESILQDIVNLSAVARKIRPIVEGVRLEAVSEGAIVIALKRYATHLRKHRALPVRHPVCSMSVRSGLTALIFVNSPVLQAVHAQLLSRKLQADSFIHFAQGSKETSFLISEDCLEHIRELTKRESLVVQYASLSAISARMSSAAMDAAGVFAPFVQALAWQQISVCQIVSYFTEITFIVSDKDADAAYATIKSVMSDASC